MPPTPLLPPPTPPLTPPPHPILARYPELLRPAKILTSMSSTQGCKPKNL